MKNFKSLYTEILENYTPEDSVLWEVRCYSKDDSPIGEGDSGFLGAHRLGTQSTVDYGTPGKFRHSLQPTQKQ